MWHDLCISKKVAEIVSNEKNHQMPKPSSEIKAIQYPTDISLKI